MSESTLALAHRTEARALWALCYRMTGVAADADELVQETFVRALEAKPSDQQPLRPYLFQIASRLCVDRLRHRRVEGYRGPWLPSPVEDDALGFEQPASATYDALESASIGFLLALEALTPEQRAALLLSEVFDVSTSDIAQWLSTTAENVRQLKHRAHAALEGVRRPQRLPGRASREREVLERFYSALITGDRAAARALLAPDVRVLSDGGGEYEAAMVPIVGAERTLTLWERLLTLRGTPTDFTFIRVNDAAAFDATFSTSAPRQAPRTITGVVLDDDDRIALFFSVLATRKLARVL